MEHFIGRENELDQIGQFCKGNDSKLLFVVGESGIGKTRLLNEFARKAQHSYLIFNFRPETGESISNYIFQWFKDLQTGKVFFKGQDGWKGIMHNEARIADFIKLALSHERSSMPFRLAELSDRISSILKSDGKLVIIIDPERDLDERDSDELLKSLFNRKLSKVKIVSTQRTTNIIDKKNGFLDYDKISVLTLLGFSENESRKILLESGLIDKIEEGLAQRFQRKSEGNPLYIEYSVTLLRQALKDGETIESAIDYLPCGLCDLMLKLYGKIHKNESRNIIHWASIVSGGIDIDMISFLTTLPKDKIFGLLKDKELKMIINLEDSEESYNSETGTMSSTDKFNTNRHARKIIIKPLHPKLSDVVIKKLLEHGDYQSCMYKRLSAYFLKKLLDSKDSFEALRFYHLYLYRSMDRESYIKASSGLIEKFYSFCLKDSCIEILERVIKYYKELGKSKEDYVQFISKAGIIYHEQRYIDKAIEFFNQSTSIHNDISNCRFYEIEF